MGITNAHCRSVSTHSSAQLTFELVIVIDAVWSLSDNNFTKDDILLLKIDLSIFTKFDGKAVLCDAQLTTVLVTVCVGL